MKFSERSRNSKGKSLNYYGVKFNPIEVSPQDFKDCESEISVASRRG